MARRRWIYIGGQAYEVGVDIMPEQSGGNAPAVLGDIPDFVSPIDGSVVSGRRGLRDHCARHDVVPTQELKGLPPKPTYTAEIPKAHREATKRTIAEIINSRNY